MICQKRRELTTATNKFRTGQSLHEGDTRRGEKQNSLDYRDGPANEWGQSTGAQVGVNIVYFKMYLLICSIISVKATYATIYLLVQIKGD